jgi:release factor glutamine methyltransferase
MNSTQALHHIVQSILGQYGPGEAVSIAAIVLEDAFGIKPTQIAANKALDAAQQAQLGRIVERLKTDEPVQYILGRTVFFGLPLRVNPHVLIPRQETEELVAWVLEAVGSQQPPASSRAEGFHYRFLDIGTGSGCIPIAVKHKRPRWEVHALDISPGALQTAKENAAMNGQEVHFHQVDILDENAWDALPSFDIIASNPPYITEDEKGILPKNVVDFEPHLALFSGGNDAQRFVRKIADFALRHLSPGGFLFFETNEFYAPDTQRILQEKGFKDVELRKDLNGKDRMIKAGK